jgi:predicted nucleic acid-binding protein
MQKQRVYVETTVIGYLTSRPSSNPVVAGHQERTREWWANASSRFHLHVSQPVIDECAAGDVTAAAERLGIVKPLVLLRTTSDAERLARDLLAAEAVPRSQPRDALHIAIAAANGIEYLVTWNFRHIANAFKLGHIERICRGAGFEPPVICSPDSLSEE